MLSLNFAYCSSGKVWSGMRFPMSHIVGCDDSKPRNCNTCLLESSRSITARSLVGATKSTSNCGRNVMDPPDVTIVHLAPEEFNYTMSVFRRIFHYESTLLQTQVPWRQVGPLDYLQSLRPQIDQFLTFHGVSSTRRWWRTQI